jgi:hypothetical protein
MTCDSWQVSNTDAYFAVTGHWIEVDNAGKWALKSALLGFPQLHNAHVGKRLGQLLFRVCERVNILGKVRLFFYRCSTSSISAFV